MFFLLLLAINRNVRSSDGTHFDFVQRLLAGHFDTEIKYHNELLSMKKKSFSRLGLQKKSFQKMIF